MVKPPNGGKKAILGTRVQSFIRCDGRQILLMQIDTETPEMDPELGNR
jgi:hypothetical protein